jgi:hypothetical protein
MAYDLLIKGGTVIDPAQQLHAVQDVTDRNFKRNFSRRFR